MFLKENFFFTGLVLVGEIVVLGLIRPTVPKGIADICRVVIFVIVLRLFGKLSI